MANPTYVFVVVIVVAIVFLAINISQEPIKIAYGRWLGALKEFDPRRFQEIWPYGDGPNEFDKLVTQVKQELNKHEYGPEDLRPWEIEVLNHLLAKWPGLVRFDFSEAVRIAQELGLIDAKLRPNPNAGYVDETERRHRKLAELYGQDTADYYRRQPEPKTDDDL